MESIFGHITAPEWFGVGLGLAITWILRWNKDKDVFDARDEEFSNLQWIKQWFTKKYDNIVAHSAVSFAGLWVGVDNLQAWMGEQMSFPQGVDETGAALVIGFIGSYLTEILKKPL